MLALVSVVIVIAVAIAGLNMFSVQSLSRIAESYDKVEIENQLVPQKNERGGWYFTTDREFRVMHLTDIHIGGGFLSTGSDRT